MNWLYFPRSKIFAKIRQLCWCDLKHWPDPIIVSWNICKSKALFLKWFEKFNCLNYHTLNFCKNTLDLMKSLENLHCFYRELTFCFFSGGNVFAKRKAFLLMQLENLTCPYYNKVKIFEKIRQVFWSNLNCTDYHGLEFSK